MHADVDLILEHKEEATEVLDRGGRAVARSSCLSKVLNRSVKAAARGAVPFFFTGA